jgi:hypothetical protein
LTIYEVRDAADKIVSVAEACEFANRAGHLPSLICSMTQGSMKDGRRC